MPSNVAPNPVTDEINRMLALGIQSYAQRNGLLIEFIADQSEDRQQSPNFNVTTGWSKEPGFITIVTPGGDIVTGFVTGLCKLKLAQPDPASGVQSCVRNCSQFFESAFNHVPAFVAGVKWQLTSHPIEE
jgi:hypothetical protein